MDVALAGRGAEGGGPRGSGARVGMATAAGAGAGAGARDAGAGVGAGAYARGGARGSACGPARVEDGPDEKGAALFRDGAGADAGAGAGGSPRVKDGPAVGGGARGEGRG